MDRRCKYCGRSVQDQNLYCDEFCRALYCRKEKLKRRRKSPESDGWRLFIEAQRAAEKEGRRLTYGQWQTQRIMEKLAEADGANSAHKRD